MGRMPAPVTVRCDVEATLPVIGGKWKILVVWFLERRRKPHRRNSSRNAVTASRVQIMTAAALLKEKANPTDADIDAAMSGNICRRDLRAHSRRDPRSNETLAA